MNEEVTNTTTTEAHTTEMPPTSRPKGMRGRHKKNCLCEKCMKKKAERIAEYSTENTTAAEGVPEKVDTLEAMRLKFAGNRVNNEPIKEPANPLPNGASSEAVQIEQLPERNMVSGMFFLMLIDAIFPAIVLKIGSVISPKFKKIKLSRLKLTATEKKELEDVADIVARDMLKEASPIQMLVTMLLLTYAGKIIDEI